MNWSDLQLITFAKINIMMKRISFLLSVIFLTTAGFLCKPAGKYGKVLSSEQRLRVDLTKLASDEFEGRAVGTAGEIKAGAYIAARFESIGLTQKATAAGFRSLHLFRMLRLRCIKRATVRRWEWLW